MENHTGDLKAREKRPQFTKDMKEELTMSEKILDFLKGSNDVRSAPLLPFNALPFGAHSQARRSMSACPLHKHADHHSQLEDHC